MPASRYVRQARRELSDAPTIYRNWIERGLAGDKSDSLDAKPSGAPTSAGNEREVVSPISFKYNLYSPGGPALLKNPDVRLDCFEVNP
jgi:hypothetical protein